MAQKTTKSRLRSTYQKSKRIQPQSPTFRASKGVGTAGGGRKVRRAPAPSPGTPPKAKGPGYDPGTGLRRITPYDLYRAVVYGELPQGYEDWIAGMAQEDLAPMSVRGLPGTGQASTYLPWTTSFYGPQMGGGYGAFGLNPLLYGGFAQRQPWNPVYPFGQLTGGR